MLSPFLARRFPTAHQLLCAAGSGLISTLTDPQQQDLLAQQVCSYALQEFSQGECWSSGPLTLYFVAS